MSGYIDFCYFEGKYKQNILIASTTVLNIYPKETLFNNIKLMHNNFNKKAHLRPWKIDQTKNAPDSLTKAALKSYNKKRNM